MTRRARQAIMAVAITASAVGGLATTATADPAAAKKANNEGMRWYKQGEYDKALEAFTRAIGEEPTLVKAHYNRASMAALVGDWDVLGEEFRWLRASKDAEATRVLTKSKTDPDFAGARLVDEGRVAMGAKPVDETPVDALLLEAAGAWKGIDEGMMQGFLEYTFAPGGKLRARSHDGEGGRWFETSMRWKVVDRAVILSARKTQETWRLQPCESRNETGGFCLVEEDGNRWLAR